MFTDRYPLFLVSLLLAFVAQGCAQEPVPEDDNEARATIQSMYEGYRNSFPGIDEISPAEISDDYKAGNLVIVDVRTPKEQEVSMIPGAITKEQFEAHRSDFEGEHVVVHCTIGFRSGLYVKKLKEDGFKAENMSGSILSWTHEGLPLEDPDGNPTKRVHVFGKQWNLVADGYEAVW